MYFDVDSASNNQVLQPCGYIYTPAFSNETKKPPPERRGRRYETGLADTLIDQGRDGGKILRGECAYAGIDGQAGDLVHLGEEDLLDGEEPLQVKHLVEAGADPALRDAIFRGGGEIDTADDDVAGFLAGCLEHLGKDSGDVTVLGSDGLEVGVGGDVGGQESGYLEILLLYRKGFCSLKH